MCRCRITPEQYSERSKKRYLAQRPKALRKRSARDALSPPPREYKVSKRPRICKKGTQQGPLPQSGQDESLLLKKLPAEIRLQIWGEVVGGKTIHILRKMGKVGHRVCAGKECEHCPGYFPVYTMGDPPREYEPFNKNKVLAKTSLIPLLMTCRQIYAEAIGLLYTTNTFDFPHVWNLDFFKSTTLPKRFSAIRSISLNHRFEAKQYGDIPSDVWQGSLIPYPTPHQDWQNTAGALNAMTSLRELVFRVARTAFRNQAPVPNGVQKPFTELNKVTPHLEKFVIIVPYADQWYNVNVALMQKGLNERGIKCRVVEEVPPPPPPPPPHMPIPLPVTTFTPSCGTGVVSAGSVWSGSSSAMLPPPPPPPTPPQAPMMPPVAL